MSLWAAARRSLLLTSTGIVFVAAMAVVGTTAVPVPSLGEGFLLPVPLSVFLPLAPVGIAVFCLTNTPPSIETSAVRPVAWFDSIGTIAFTGLVVVLCVGLYGVTDGNVMVQGARNLVGYLGIALAFLVMLGPRAASFIPAGFAVMVSTFGRTGTASVAWWAWPLAPAWDGAATAQGGFLFLSGVLLLGIAGRPTSNTRS